MNHYNPQIYNDLFSKKVYELYLKRIDYNKEFFLQKDIVIINRYQTEIDNQLKKANLYFFKIAMTLKEKRVRLMKKVVEELFDFSFNYAKKETFEMDPEKRDFFATDEELKDFWRKKIKLAILDQIYLEENKEENSKKKVLFTVLENKAKEYVKKEVNLFFKRLIEISKTEQFYVYLDSIINPHDPHSSFLPPSSKEDFDISMSGKLEGIGAVLSAKDGFIEVIRIIPGSASYRQKQLKAGDMILKVGQGDGEPIDVVGMKTSEVVRFIRGKKGTKVRLTVKKKDGSFINIPIIRDVVVIEETYARSAAIKLNKEAKATFGYIYLPKFYRDFQDSGGRNASDDVRKKLIRFNKMGVKGILLDLRDNSGGALVDAIETAGLFIKKGPIVQVLNQYKGINVYEDPDKKIVYEGPLVILINANSASASEILAAALQDYKRAVIVGSTHSFGKGTVQQLLPLDQIFKALLDSKYKSFGTLRLTIQKFYRINGGTTQFKGVRSDIVLSDIYSFSDDYGEKGLDYSLPWDEINEVFYQPWKRSFDFDSLRKKSRQRVKKNTFFVFLNEHEDDIKKRNKNTLINLDRKNYFKNRNEVKKWSDQLQDVNLEKRSLSFLEKKYSKGEKKKIGFKEKKKIVQDWYRELEKDAYLEESIYILNDLAQ